MIGVLAQRRTKTHMPAFSVFFDGPQAFGIHPVEATDADHAIEIVSRTYPGSRLSAVPTSFLDGCDKHKILVAWITGRATVKIESLSKDY